jgi:hypothetical protein
MNIEEQLKKYNILKGEDNIEALNIISKHLNVGLNEINVAIKKCQNKYVHYNYQNIYNEIKSKISDDYSLSLINKIDLILNDLNQKTQQIKKQDEIVKIKNDFTVLREKVFLLETFLRALRDYL